MRPPAELVGEITTIVKRGAAVIQTNTTYDGDRVVAQTVTRREYGGVIRTFEITYGDKLVP